MFKILYSCVYLFILGPMFEWFLHYFLHKINNKYHKEHHILFYKNKINVEQLPILTISLFLYLNCPILLLLNLQYFVIHTIIHKHPNIFNGFFSYLVKHHITHHKNPDYNFGVSYIWVDKLFNTYKP
jgi:hypothetical protein